MIDSSHLVFSHPDYEADLFAECVRLGISLEKIGKNLYLVDPKKIAKHKSSLIWARDQWDAEIFDFSSVTHAANELRKRSKRPWIQVTTNSHRRGELIELTFNSKAKQKKIRQKKCAWPDAVDRSRENPAFTLLSPTRIAICSIPREEVPGGDWLFEEERSGPPSRAYLKLWEWGWRSLVLPKTGEVAIDLGASPGGWTWVLAKAGLTVHAFDRSPLKLDLPNHVQSRIHFSKGDAFLIRPENAPRADWVFCDVIAEPKRTLELIEAWLPSTSGLVFTIKFKGATDFAAIDHLRKIPDSNLAHLNVNKHEVTFWRLPQKPSVSI